MEKFNHDLTQGSRLGVISEGRRGRKKRSHFLAYEYYSMHQNPSPNSNWNGILLQCAVFPNWMLSLVPG